MPSKAPLRLRCLHFVCLFFRPSVDRKREHIVRDEGNASFSFSISVVAFKYSTLRLCGICHVSVKPKFTEEKNSWKICTLVERRRKIFNEGPIYVKEKHEKGVNSVVFVASSGVRSIFSRDRRQRYMFVTDRFSAVSLKKKKRKNVKCPVGFSEFWFRLADERICNWWCEAALRARFWPTTTKIPSPFVRTDSIFPGCNYAGCQERQGSTGVDVNNRFCRGLPTFA